MFLRNCLLVVMLFMLLLVHGVMQAHAATYTQLTTFAAGITGQSANVLYIVTDSAGVTKIASSGVGVSEETDAAGNGAGIYKASLTFNSTWSYPLEIHWTITGQAGVAASAVYGSETSVLNAGLGVTLAGTQAFDNSAQATPSPVNVTQWGGVAPAALSGTGHYVQTMVMRWLTDNASGTPVALSTNGYLQTMLMRWLTDNGSGTPNALTGGRTDSSLGAYQAGLDPATLLFVSPGNKLATNASGQVDLDLNQPLDAMKLPLTNLSSNIVGNAFWSSISQGGKQVTNGTSYVVYELSGGTVVRTFTLSVPVATAVTRQ